MINQERKRYEIASLVPWHPTGTLSHRDAQRVEQALAEDGVRAQRYELLLEELAAAVRQLFAAIVAEEAHLPRSWRPSFSETPATASASR
jgi:hypothetical protein